MKLKKWSRHLRLTAGLILLVGAFWGCSNRPTWEFMPDMAESPALKAQEYDALLPHHRAMRLPVEGTIPRDFEPYRYKGDLAGAEANLINPLPRTEAVLSAGQAVYRTYCEVCHGARGLGDGSVVPPFPKPPSFHTDKARAYGDGRIFHIITEGQNNIMPSYASQIVPEKRWAAIHYVRLLQLAENPGGEDVDAFKTYLKEFKEGAK